jgi:hypothetical protein
VGFLRRGEGVACVLAIEKGLTLERVSPFSRIQLQLKALDLEELLEAVHAQLAANA